MNAPETINVGVPNQIGHYADAIRVPAGYGRSSPRGHRG